MILTILLATLLAVIAFAERIAFAVLIAMAAHWLWKVSAPLRVRLVAAFLIVRGRVRLVIDGLQRRYAMWVLRSQLAGGATP